MCRRFFFFFFNDTATTEIYTLSLHDALPILAAFAYLLSGINLLTPFERVGAMSASLLITSALFLPIVLLRDRKSTRLNSSHQIISYAVFCLKKKNQSRTSSETLAHNLKHLAH